MKSEDIRHHWENWAKTYGTGLRATTYAPTLKELEIDALYKQIRYLKLKNVLEVGCGNGLNTIALAKLFPHAQFHGVDYVPEMIVAAMENGKGVENVRFLALDLMQLNLPNYLDPEYDLVFTVRCLISLNTVEQQKRGISALAAKVKSGGYLMMIENSQQTYATQNILRGFLGLPERKCPEYNLFIDEGEILGHILDIGLRCINIVDLLSLHDLMLYVLLPALNDDPMKWEYDHPLVKVATELSKMGVNFGSFGQGRLFVCGKP